MKRILSLISFYFPIRFKFLLVELLVVTSAIGVITVTMARLFHADKTAYIHDLTSTMALHTAEETHALLRSYQERLQVFARLMAEDGVAPERKSDMLKKLFQDFREFVMIAEYDGPNEKNMVYDAKAFEAAGLTKESVLQYHRAHPFPLERIRKGEVFVANSTVSAKMPTMTLAVVEPDTDPGHATVIAAVVRLDSLIKLAGRSRVFETFILEDKGSLLGHADAKKVAAHLKPAGIPGTNDLTKGGGLVKTAEYRQDGTDTVGGLALVDFGGLVSVVEIPKATAYLTAKTLLHSLLGVAFMLLMTSALLSFFWSSRLTRPIEKLSKATQVLGHGNFDIQVQPDSRDEIGDLANSFNHMATELKDRDSALKVAQGQLVQSEKMAAFGQLGAGIAHEVKNPLAGILGFAQLSLRAVEAGSPLHNNLATIEKETKRCKLIIDNLLKFARQEKVTYSRVDINTVVEDSAAIVDHQLGLNNVKLEKALAPELPPIFGNGNQIEQVLINMMINAQQAMDGKPGTIWLSTAFTATEEIEVRIKDDGPGIPEEIQVKIFEPFFTTKAAGKGTGLGLSVSYGIIKDHKGDIKLVSEVGTGTEFIITFPRAPYHVMRQHPSTEEAAQAAAGGAQGESGPAQQQVQDQAPQQLAQDQAAQGQSFDAAAVTGEPAAQSAPAEARDHGAKPVATPVPGPGDQQAVAAPAPEVAPQRTPWRRSQACASLEAELAQARPERTAPAPDSAAASAGDGASLVGPPAAERAKAPVAPAAAPQRQPWRRPALPFSSIEEALAEVQPNEAPLAANTASDGTDGTTTKSVCDGSTARAEAGTMAASVRQPWRRPALPFASIEEALAEVSVPQAVAPEKGEPPAAAPPCHPPAPAKPAQKRRPAAETQPEAGSPEVGSPAEAPPQPAASGVAQPEERPGQDSLT